MAHHMQNPWRGRGLAGADLFPLADAGDVAGLLRQCPAHAPTPLRDVPELAARLGVARLWLKDERARMGLGSFKALGAAHAIAREAAATGMTDLPGVAGERLCDRQRRQSRAVGGRRCAALRGARGGLSGRNGARSLCRPPERQGRRGGARRRRLRGQHAGCSRGRKDEMAGRCCPTVHGRATPNCRCGSWRAICNWPPRPPHRSTPCQVISCCRRVSAVWPPPWPRMRGMSGATARRSSSSSRRRRRP